MRITCAICEELFNGEDREIIFATKCGHIFHHQCLTKWLERSDTCPQCRQRASKKKIYRIFFNMSDENESSAVASLIDGLEMELHEKTEEIEKMNSERQQNFHLVEELRQKVVDASKELEQAICSMKEKVASLEKSCSAYDPLSPKNEASENIIASFSGGNGEEETEQPQYLSCESSDDSLIILPTAGKIHEGNRNPLKRIFTGSTASARDDGRSCLRQPILKVSSQSRIIKKVKRRNNRESHTHHNTSHIEHVG
ncbi:E3 ubiquitin-protein ligase TRAIP [Nilaparvata lugens]|uniref:E3 ubiquitin-protein ligase TRAIP n=1 Tax=Nilaparvata lugens TaxID=108931 RepID=UPI00193E5479|nr:E3 ubiquitin-protein ligase TRAIP [Nilaparvata lugens]XP_039278963.1 E3 ubiquitin-protein ligase TRAIP [Nilaparvata lugens]